MIPLDFLRDLLEEFSTASPWAFLLAKATLLLAVAWLIHFSLARANPRWRTLLWRGGLASLVLTAIWTLGLPGVKLRIPAPEPIATSPAPYVSPAIAESDPRAAESAIVRRTEIPDPVAAEATPRQEPVEARPDVARPGESWGRWLSWPVALLGIWGFGVALLVMRLAVALIRLAGLLRTSQAATGEVVAQVGQIAAALGCRRAVQVRISRQYAVPFQCGLMSPILVLPERMCQPDYRRELPALCRERRFCGPQRYGGDRGRQRRHGPPLGGPDRPPEIAAPGCRSGPRAGGLS